MSATGFLDASNLAERRGCQPLATAPQLTRSATLPEQYGRPDMYPSWDQSGMVAPGSAPLYPHSNSSLYQSVQQHQQHQPAMGLPQYAQIPAPHYHMAPGNGNRADAPLVRRAVSAHAKGSDGRNWTQEQDNRLRAAIAQVSYETKRNGKVGDASLDSPILGAHPTTKPWARVMSIAFPSGEHSKEECQSRWKTLHRPPAVKGAWSKAEDDRLLRLVRQHGAERWVVIAQHMGSRSGKQCRERWHNHVDPSITRRPFTPEEDAIILSLYNTIGSKWAEMSKRLKGRPDNSIKNHFNTTLSRRRMLAAAVNKASNLVDEQQDDLSSSTQPSLGSTSLSSTSSGSFTSVPTNAADSYDDSGFYSSTSTPTHKAAMLPSSFADVGVVPTFDVRRSSAPSVGRQSAITSGVVAPYAPHACSGEFDAFSYTSRDGIVYRHSAAPQHSVVQSHPHRASVPNSFAYAQAAGLPQAQHAGYASMQHASSGRLPAVEYTEPAPSAVLEYHQLHGHHAALWSNAPPPSQPTFRPQQMSTPSSAQHKSSSPSSTSNADALVSHSTPRRETSGEQPLAESLSAWQSVNGERALPPLSLVAGATTTPTTPSRARVTSAMTRLTSSACGTVTTGAASGAGSANAALAMVDVDEGQKAALPPLFRQAASNSTPTQRNGSSNLASSTRSPSYGPEHGRSATRRSFEVPTQESELCHERQSTVRTHTSHQLRSDSNTMSIVIQDDESAIDDAQTCENEAETSGSASECPDGTPSFTTEAAYFSQREGLSMPGSTLTAASSLLPSPMDCMSDSGAAHSNDYFASKDHAATMDRHVQYSFQQGSNNASTADFSPYNFGAQGAMGLYIEENESRNA